MDTHYAHINTGSTNVYTWTPPLSRKENTMSEFNEVQRAREARDVAQRRYDHAKAKSAHWQSKRLAALRALEQADLELVTARQPKEPEVGTKIVFKKRFVSGGPTYEFVAFRASDGKWYATGVAGPNGSTWGTFVNFVRDQNLIPFRYDVLVAKPF